METTEYRLGDVCKLRNGYAFKSENFSNEGIPVIRISNIKDDEATSNDALRTAESSVFEKFRIYKGDILIAMSGATTGKFGRYNSDHKAYQNQRVGCFVIQDENKLNLDYLYILLKGLQKKIELDAYGGGQPNISASIIENYKIRLPSLENQVRISKILYKAQSLIKLRETSIKLLDEFLKMKFIKLFGTLSSPKFPTKPLKTFALKITDGTHQSPKFTESGIPFLFVSNIKNDEIIYETDRFISEEEYDILIKRTPIEIGDILYTSVGSYGNPAIVKSLKKFCFQRHIAYIKPNENRINYIFLFGALKSDFVKAQVERSVRGAAQKTLNLSDLKALLIPDVPKELQIKYAEVVNEIEKIKKSFISSKSFLIDLYHSLSSKALKGQLETIERGVIEGIMDVQPKVSGDVIAVEKINKELEEFHKSQPHTGAPDEIDNTIRQLEVELKIRGEIPFWDEYVKYRIVKGKFKEPFTFAQLWEEITKFPFEAVPAYDKMANLLFKWLSEENAFIKQRFNESTKEIELIVHETAEA
ncbi:restriction endonuclease subunit S [Mucilaginibacter lacusdianchii]|uniref:restriction endonuclease subunit S n=1 Tax=Mucilaginibacter lacusdianchii TaxID=2684211 RepID=UPI00131B8236|nr:restriction endonuclease subunit S [Mucilaginibacter sp. JXJ CY 39]